MEQRFTCQKTVKWRLCCTGTSGYVYDFEVVSGKDTKGCMFAMCLYVIYHEIYIALGEYFLLWQFLNDSDCRTKDKKIKTFYLSTESKP